MLRHALRRSPALARQLGSLGPGTARHVSSAAEAAGSSAAPAAGSASTAAVPAPAATAGGWEGGGSDAGGEAGWSWDEELKQLGELLLFGAAMHVLTSCFLCTTQCVGPSMTPTISTDGDVLLAVPFCLYRRVHGGLPRLDSVVLCTSPSNPDQTICKRVLGLPGETVTVLPPPGRASALRHFGAAPGTLHRMAAEPPPGTREYQLPLPQGHIWLQGDNLSDSTDSRIYGPVPVELIQSVAVLRLWPFRTAGLLPTAPPRVAALEPPVHREVLPALAVLEEMRVGGEVGETALGTGATSVTALRRAASRQTASIPAGMIPTAALPEASTPGNAFGGLLSPPGAGTPPDALPVRVAVALPGADETSPLASAGGQTTGGGGAGSPALDKAEPPTEGAVPGGAGTEIGSRGAVVIIESGGGGDGGGAEGGGGAGTGPSAPVSSAPVSSVADRVSAAAAVLPLVKAGLYKIEDETARDEVRRAVAQVEQALDKLNRLQREGRGDRPGGG